MGRILSSIGIGSATVDTVFPRTELVPGETVTADVELYGGDATQEIDGVYFVLKTEHDGEKRTVAEFAADSAVTLEPDDERTIPVEMEIPVWTPLTRDGTTVWLETGLDIDWARDPTDEDRIEIVPDEYTAALLAAVDDLGFETTGSELIETDYLDDRPFAQALSFRPTGDGLAADLDELTVTLVPRADDLRAFVEFDQHDRVAEEYDQEFDEQEISFTFERASVAAIRGRLKNELRNQT
ncbi:MAG: sporulation protein [Haloarculaceae archaeon]